MSSLMARPGSLRLFVAFVAAFVVAAVVLVASPKSAFAKSGAVMAEPLVLDVPGHQPAYYYKPRTRDQRHILMFLHGRGGNPAEDCRKWARVASQFGWVVCPQGPEDRGGGARAWNNDPGAAKDIIDATVAALHEEYKGHVRTRGNVLIGFSEGAFIGMQVGLKDPKTWSRWLILGASDVYWMGGDAKAELEENKNRIRRVYLLTGENDGVAENTRKVGDMLKDAKIPVKVRIVSGMGHEVPADRMITNYRRPLRWLFATK